MNSRNQYLGREIDKTKNETKFIDPQEEIAVARGYSMADFGPLMTTEEIRRWPYYLGLVS